MQPNEILCDTAFSFSPTRNVAWRSSLPCGRRKIKEQNQINRCDFCESGETMRLIEQIPTCLWNFPRLSAPPTTSN